MILCDEWTPAQVKAFRLMVNRSVTWADWDEELLALELQELSEADFDLSLTGFDPRRSTACSRCRTRRAAERCAAAAREPGLPRRRPVALRAAPRPLRGRHQPGGGGAAAGERKPLLMVTDPPYGIELDSEWRDRAGLNGCGPAESRAT